MGFARPEMRAALLINRPSIIRVSADMQLDDYAFCASLVPEAALGRGDIINNMWLALRERRVTRETLRLRDFVRGFYQANFELAGYATPLDDVAFALS